MSWTEAQVRALHSDYQRTGDSLAVVGARHGISHEAVRQLFKHYGLPTRTSSEQVAQRQAELSLRAEAERQRIIDLYKAHGTVQAVLERVALPRKVVAPIIASIPNRENYRRQSVLPSYSRHALIRDLQLAARLTGEPLTISAYRSAAKQTGLAAYNSVVKCFKHEDPDQPWQAALKAAGVKGNPPRGKYAHAFTPEQCVQAVALCIQAHHHQRVSYNTYSDWAPAELPSGPTVRNVVGWNNAVNQALDRLAHSVL